MESAAPSWSRLSWGLTDQGLPQMTTRFQTLLLNAPRMDPVSLPVTPSPPSSPSSPPRPSKTRRNSSKPYSQALRPSTSMQRARLAAKVEYKRFLRKYGALATEAAFLSGLEGGQRDLNHDALSCRQCDLSSTPVSYCDRSCYHPEHPYYDPEVNGRW